MSIRAQTLVRERSRAKGSNLLVLLTIADYARDDGCYAWPAARTLAWQCRMTTRAGELILRKLVEDGEVWPEEGDSRLYLNIRCIFDWDRYKTEGPPLPEREKISRSSSEKFSRRLVGMAQERAKRFLNCERVDDDCEKPVIDPLYRSVTDPLKQGAGEPRLTLDPVDGVENPLDHVGVITKVTHVVIDEQEALGQRPDLGEIAALVSDECRTLGIATDTEAIRRAVDSAIWQRKPTNKTRKEIPHHARPD